MDIGGRRHHLGDSKNAKEVSMKLIRKESDKAMIARIYERCSSLNPNIDKGLSPFLFRFLEAADEVLTKEQWASVAERLTSERVKQKRILERLAKLGAKLEESDIAKLEQKLERRNASVDTDFAQKHAENS
jgi:hypothetical protein